MPRISMIAESEAEALMRGAEEVRTIVRRLVDTEGVYISSAAVMLAVVGCRMLAHGEHLSKIADFLDDLYADAAQQQGIDLGAIDEDTVCEGPVQ